MDKPELLIPLIGVAMIFATPLVLILTKHQQRMAELLHRSAAPALDPRIDTLQRDMAELKDLVHRQTLALDGMARSGSIPQRIEERVGG